MSFASPGVLIALVAVPLLAALYVARERRRDRAAAVFVNPALLPNIVDRNPGVRRHLPVAILLVALAALIVGVARPHATVSVKREDATVVVVVDVSRSMEAKDVPPSRLGAARAAAARLAAEVPARFRLALVSFGSRAAVTLPPTADRQLFRQALATLRPGQGTALGDAVLLAVRIGQRERDADGHIPPESVLVISDGAAQGGVVTPGKAAERARAAHVPVSAIVLGTPEGVVQATLQGKYHVTIQVPPNPATLRSLTRETGGELYTVPTDARLRDVYTRLASHLGRQKTTRELSDVFGGGAIALLLLGGTLSTLWFRRLP